MTNLKPLNIFLAAPRGFCAGVDRAILIVEKAVETFGPPVYVRHEIVHNKRVIEDLKKKGVIFVHEIDEIPENAITIFSAHGVSKKVIHDSSNRNLITIDATCPLVTKVHNEGQRYAKKEYDIILIGHEGHPEVEGTQGQISGPVHVVSKIEDIENLNVRDTKKVSYITQTTLSVDDTRQIIKALKDKFPDIIGPDLKDICYATQNRQKAVRELCDKVELLIVLGAKNSSNSNRLREIGEERNIKSFLIDDATQFNEKWLHDIHNIGITAGASAPETLIEELIEKLSKIRPIKRSTLETIQENIHFKLPRFPVANNNQKVETVKAG